MLGEWSGGNVMTTNHIIKSALGIVALLGLAVSPAGPSSVASGR